MTVVKRLEGLKQISDLILDQRLLVLRAAQAARSETQARLAALDQTGTAADCVLGAAARAELLYQAWADARRKDLNLSLARQSVTEIEAADAARAAFGKQSVLARLQSMHAVRQR